MPVYLFGNTGRFGDGPFGGALGAVVEEDPIYVGDIADAETGITDGREEGGLADTVSGPVREERIVIWQ